MGKRQFYGAVIVRVAQIPDSELSEAIIVVIRVRDNYHVVEISIITLLYHIFYLLVIIYHSLEYSTIGYSVYDYES